MLWMITRQHFSVASTIRNSFEISDTFFRFFVPYIIEAVKADL